MLVGIPLAAAFGAAIVGFRKREIKNCYETIDSTSTFCAPNGLCYSVSIERDLTCRPIEYITLVPNGPTYQQKVVRAPLAVQSYGSSKQVTVTSIDTVLTPQGRVTTKFQVRPQYTGQLYVEVAGGKGADHLWYTDLGNAVTHLGGQCGRGFGTLVVTPESVIEIDYGFSAAATSPNDIRTETLPPIPGQGGLGTLLGGSSGGGATTVSIDGTVVLIVGGGGGASRNANGGDAGCSSTFQVFDTVKLNPVANDGDTNVPGNLLGSISGGGASQGAPGRSQDPNGAGQKGSGGSASESLASGAGGGGGFYGGGAGFTNGQTKPRNIQGAGGGGSCWASNKLYFNTQDGARFMNVNSQPADSVHFPRCTYVTLGFPI